MWTFQLVFKLSESAICKKGGNWLVLAYIWNYILLHSQHGLLIPTFYATQSDLHYSQSHRDQHVRQKGERTHTREKTERQRSNINLPIITKSFNTRFQRKLAANQGGNLFALTTVSVSIFSKNLIGNFAARLNRSGRKRQVIPQLWPI